MKHHSTKQYMCVIRAQEDYNNIKHMGLETSPSRPPLLSFPSVTSSPADA